MQSSANAKVRSTSFSLSDVRMPSSICDASSSSGSPLDFYSWSLAGRALFEAHTTHSIGCLRSHSAAFFSGIGQTLEGIVPQPTIHGGLIFWPKSSCCYAVTSIGQRLMNDFAVLYFTSMAVVEGLASWININSVNRFIITSLNTRCFEIDAIWL